MGPRSWLFAAGILGATGVTLGAFHAHLLEMMLAAQELEPDEIGRRLDMCETAIRFQLFHAVGLIGVAVLAAAQPKARIWNVVGFGFCAGTTFFCGALYTICLFGSTRFQQIAPLGGLFLIVSWLCVALGAVWFRFEAPGVFGDSRPPA